MEHPAVKPQLPLHVQGEGRTLRGDTAVTGFKGPIINPRSRPLYAIQDPRAAAFHMINILEKKKIVKISRISRIASLALCLHPPAKSLVFSFLQKLMLY